MVMGEVTRNGTGRAVFQAAARLRLGDAHEASSSDHDGET